MCSKNEIILWLGFVGLVPFVLLGYQAWDYQEHYAINCGGEWLMRDDTRVCDIGNCTEEQLQMLEDGNASYFVFGEYYRGVIPDRLLGEVLRVQVV